MNKIRFQGHKRESRTRKGHPNKDSRTAGHNCACAGTDRSGWSAVGGDLEMVQGWCERGAGGQAVKGQCRSGTCHG